MKIVMEHSRSNQSWTVEVYFAGEQWGNHGLSQEETLGAIAATIYAGKHPFLLKPIERIRELCRYSSIIEVFGDSEVEVPF